MCRGRRVLRRLRNDPSAQPATAARSSRWSSAWISVDNQVCPDGLPHRPSNSTRTLVPVSVFLRSRRKLSRDDSLSGRSRRSVGTGSDENFDP